MNILDISDDDKAPISVKLATIGAYMFLLSVLVTTFVALFVSYEAIAWPTMILIYPSLMLIFGGIGFSDLISLLARKSRGEQEGALFVLALAIGRGVVFVGGFFVCLIAEVAVIRSTLN